MSRKKKNNNGKFPDRKICIETYMNQSVMFKCMWDRKMDTAQEKRKKRMTHL